MPVDWPVSVPDGFEDDAVTDDYDDERDSDPSEEDQCRGIPFVIWTFKIVMDHPNAQEFFK